LDARYALRTIPIVRIAAPPRDDAYIMTLAWLGPFYLWTKAFHVVSVIAWMAGLFYLPRLYVYHCGVMRGSSESERFKVMERRLLKQIMNPAMIATWVFGLLLVLTPGVIDWSAGWWHIKLLSVLLMTGAHGAMSKWRREFLEDRNRRSHRFYRFANEIPTVLMLVIVVMVIVKPF
jgi:putative membrane protein